MPAFPDVIDPIDCPTCPAPGGELCPFHSGVMAGWDLLVTDLHPASAA